MTRRIGLTWQLFLALLGVAFSTALVVGLFARGALSRAFEEYVGALPQGMGGGRMMGRRMLGAAEQAFVARVDASVLFAAAIAMVIAAVVALVLAAYLSRPIRRLEHAAAGLAAGDLAQRVVAEGPAEVAAVGEAFNSMADSLETAEELRRRMVADVAHELRNPLAAARAQAEGMLDGIIATEPRRLESVVEDLAHLSALVDDLRELATADAGGLSYDRKPLDLAALVEAEAGRAEPLMGDGVTLIVSVGPGEHRVAGDERRLAQVVRNLLTNAARHTSEGSVSVSVEADGDRVSVSVADTGEGIAAEDLPHVFERFYRADSARAADTGGAGLGLAISRAIVRDHGGEMQVTSDRVDGTTLSFTLPAEGSSRPAAGS